jgi:magnesium transporter
MRNKKPVKPLYIDNPDEVIAQINRDIIEENHTSLRELIRKLHHADFASVLDHCPQKLQKSLITIVQDLLSSETLACMGSAAKISALHVLGNQKVAQLVENLDLEDAIEVLDDYDEEIKEGLILHLSSQKQTQVKEGFNYPEDCVGRIMEKNFLVFVDNWTVAQAIDSIRKHPLKCDFHAAIMVDKKYQPIATVPLSKLFQYQDTDSLKELVSSELKIADINDKIDDLVYFFKQYALAIIPVVNKSGKLVGSVSINNMIYIVEESTESDIMNLTGVGDQDTFSTVFETAKHRFAWLFMNLLIAFMTALVINKFSHTISKLIALASVMPIVASMGGNAGTQAMTVTVRALSKKDINHSNIVRVVLKEVAVCEFNAFWLSLIGSFFIMLIYNDIKLSLIFGISVMLNFFIAGLFGALIPITLDRLKLDPATASSVFLTALTDGFGFFTFLGLSYLVF